MDWEEGIGGRRERERGGGRYFLDLVIPFLHSDSNFYRFCHQA